MAEREGMRVLDSGFEAAREHARDLGEQGGFVRRHEVQAKGRGAADGVRRLERGDEDAFLAAEPRGDRGDGLVGEREGEDGSGALRPQPWAGEGRPQRDGGPLQCGAAGRSFLGAHDAHRGGGRGQLWRRESGAARVRRGVMAEVAGELR